MKKNIGKFWFYVEVILLILMSVIYFWDIVRDFTVRTFGQKVEATVVDLKQVAADELSIC